MTVPPVYIAGMGVVSALGCDLNATIENLNAGTCKLAPLDLFPVSAEQPQPVGAVESADHDPALPRTHRLACLAADQALAGCRQPPDAIVLGTTTGGMLSTEFLFEQQVENPEPYRRHALGSVGEALADRCGCTGPVITISTACSSGAVAIKIAMEMLRSGMAGRILAGGADSLCRLTYFGFKSLQLIDPAGARPLDCRRSGMSVAEGAALLLLTTEASESRGLQVCGGGLSCDAYHATAPHPDGSGALAAMQAALTDAGLSASDIDYINLHGTGTSDNDRSEARAVHALFVHGLPPVSSIKGATGHALAAAGAIEAVVAGACIEQGLVPGNTGFRDVDPELNLQPVRTALRMPVRTVMSNSLGFGGNNAALIIGRSRGEPCQAADRAAPLHINGWACLTGAGHTDDTWRAFRSGASVAGRLDDRSVSEGLPPQTIRRLKRLPKMALSLAANTCQAVSPDHLPAIVSMGTAWGALSETHDFLHGLIASGQRYPSPTDFIGSVHNASAGQIAMLLGARGANVTASGGDYSFEQALLSADVLTRRTADHVLVVGADEYHPVFSPRFDASVRAGNQPADGGGALLLARGSASTGPTIDLAHYQSSGDRHGLAGLIDRLGGSEILSRRFGAVLVGLPAGCRDLAGRQLDAFIAQSRFQGPLIDYRRLTGEVASASAMAVVQAAGMVSLGIVPGPLIKGADLALDGKGVMVLGLGSFLTAMRILPS